ncbi:MAG: heavy metal-binding domain-containing protein [Candidatus Gracilibacteria bacterium]|nr:heavy metal-binding domain-containing protein [Candidatus Gracilibacteria bacterium]
MLDLIILISLLGLGYFFGHKAEQNHYKRIIAKEKELIDIVVLTKTDVKNLGAETGEIVSGTIVVSIDYFKKFIASFVQFFGGRVKSYESLLDRARRDTLVKIKQQAKDGGYNAIANLKIETSSISKGQKGQIVSVEVLSYATAVKITN